MPGISGRSTHIYAQFYAQFYAQCRIGALSGLTEDCEGNSRTACNYLQSLVGDMALSKDLP